MVSNLHHPPHLFIDNSWYFLSAHTLGKDYFLKSQEVKEFWVSKLQSCANEFKVKIKAYVILDNHYHILCYFPVSKLIPEFIARLHGATSHHINQLENQPQRKVWHNYWDRIIRDEVDFWTKFNYIQYNPVKHGYVKRSEEWNYSTYQRYLGQKGEDWMNILLQHDNIIEYEFEN